MLLLPGIPKARRLEKKTQNFKEKRVIFTKYNTSMNYASTKF
jgi:hypothetical protein